MYKRCYEESTVAVTAHFFDFNIIIVQIWHLVTLKQFSQNRQSTWIDVETGQARGATTQLQACLCWHRIWKKDIQTTDIVHAL